MKIWIDGLFGLIKYIDPKWAYTENLQKPVLIRTIKLMKWILGFMLFCSKFCEALEYAINTLMPVPQQREMFQ